MKAQDGKGGRQRAFIATEEGSDRSDRLWWCPTMVASGRSYKELLFTAESKGMCTQYGY